MIKLNFFLQLFSRIIPAPAPKHPHLHLRKIHPQHGRMIQMMITLIGRTIQKHMKKMMSLSTQTMNQSHSAFWSVLPCLKKRRVPQLKNLMGKVVLLLKAPHRTCQERLRKSESGPEQRRLTYVRFGKRKYTSMIVKTGTIEITERRKRLSTECQLSWK